MLITQITELNKAKCKVYIDGEFAFVLYKGELHLYHISEGQEIDSDTFEEIMHKVLPKRAKLRAMNLLQKREYTVAQLRTKLSENLYPESIINEALTYVASYGYTDDFRYAEGYITDNESAKSRRRIEMDLRNRGISSDTIERAFVAWADKGGRSDEITMIYALLKKRHFDPATADYKERQKQAAYLAGKGFSMDNIFKCLQNDPLDD